MWRVHIEVAAPGADMLAPIFEAQTAAGQICCQVDPRDMTDVDAMLAQARRIHATRPNIMVKLPGTAEGIEAVRILTAEGIPTNVTLGFTVAQLVATGEAAQAGLAEAPAGLGDGPPQLALVRRDDVGPLRGRAAIQGASCRRGIELTDADLRWAGIAISGRRTPFFTSVATLQVDGRVSAASAHGRRHQRACGTWRSWPGQMPS